MIENSTTSKARHLDVSIERWMLAAVDDFRFAARFYSRSGAIRHLIKIAMHGDASRDHRAILSRLDRKNFPANERAAGEVKKSGTAKRVHITFDQNEIDKIDDYFRAERLWSRCETIRHLVHTALNTKPTRPGILSPYDGDVIRGTDGPPAVSTAKFDVGNTSETSGNEAPSKRPAVRQRLLTHDAA